MRLPDLPPERPLVIVEAYAQTEGFCLRRRTASQFGQTSSRAIALAVVHSGSHRSGIGNAPSSTPSIITRSAEPPVWELYCA
jgi:hypothetical protein